VEQPMVVIDPPEPTGNVLQPTAENPGPYFTGSGDVDLVCGKCGFQLTKGAAMIDIGNVILVCPQCGAYNR
jgi:hypothetical protein